jgi:hypothetical protein
MMSVLIVDVQEWYCRLAYTTTQSLRCIAVQFFNKLIKNRVKTN